MPRTRFLVSSSAVVLALATVGAAASRPARNSAAAPAATDSISAEADAGRILGAPTARVWLIEASDFQCPFCKQWHDESFATILKDYVNTGKVRYAFLNDPLAMHQFSMQAAEAAMCASAQDKFWPMHQELFETQHAWEVLPNPAAYFDSLAVKAGVNATEWRTCVRTHAARPIIDADRYRLRTSGVQSTPTFFVGNQRLEGVQPLAVMRKVLDDALAKAGTP